MEARTSLSAAGPSVTVPAALRAQRDRGSKRGDSVGGAVALCRPSLLNKR